LRFGFFQAGLHHDKTRRVFLSHRVEKSKLQILYLLLIQFTIFQPGWLVKTRRVWLKKKISTWLVGKNQTGLVGF